MCICVYVCIYIYIYIYVYIHNTCVYIYIYTHIRVYLSLSNLEEASDRVPPILINKFIVQKRQTTNQQTMGFRQTKNVRYTIGFV